MNFSSLSLSLALEFAFCLLFLLLLFAFSVVFCFLLHFRIHMGVNFVLFIVVAVLVFFFFFFFFCIPCTVQCRCYRYCYCCYFMFVHDRGESFRYAFTCCPVCMCVWMDFRFCIYVCENVSFWILVTVMLWFFFVYCCFLLSFLHTNTNLHQLMNVVFLSTGKPISKGVFVCCSMWNTHLLSCLNYGFFY